MSKKVFLKLQEIDFKDGSKNFMVISICINGINHGGRITVDCLMRSTMYIIDSKRVEWLEKMVENRYNDLASEGLHHNKRTVSSMVLAILKRDAAYIVKRNNII
jgi:hypothetical protein